MALIGNPNSGKTSLFNALTGLHHKVGNYPGVTVEQREGICNAGGSELRLYDLPGTYSLNPTSDDERIVRDVLFGLLPETAPLDGIVIVLDATQLERQLLLVSQVLDLELPVVVALTMVDEADQVGTEIDVQRLSELLGTTAVEVHAPSGRGLAALKQAVGLALNQETQPGRAAASQELDGALAKLTVHLAKCAAIAPRLQRQLALQLLLDRSEEHALSDVLGARELAQQLRTELETAGVAWREVDAKRRFTEARRIAEAVMVQKPGFKRSRSDRADRLMTHPIWGLGLFAAVMAAVFQAVFTWSAPAMSWIETAIGWFGRLVVSATPAGPLQGLLVDGVIGGVGAVLVFLPQILLLFFFIALLEDSGYMARAATLMNKHMRRAGLSGRSFIPMLCGFACAVPAIMATRSIPDRRDRLITMLVVPLVSCSARLPVYTLMIAAFVPATPIFGGFTWQGFTLLSAYLTSLVAAITMAFVLRRSVLQGETPPFVMELPPYRWPNWRSVATVMWERGKLFITQAGTIILAINIVLWFLASFPQQPRLAAEFDQQRAQLRQGSASSAELDAQLAALDSQEAGEKLRNSYAGRLGRLIEPAIAPLGFDWKIGIGLIGSFAAREVFVSTMATVFNISDSSGDAKTLADTLRSDVNPRTGKPVFNLLVSLNLILFFILACQCMSTVAVVKRETNGWKWPLFMVGYMTLLAYGVCLAVYQIGSRIWEL